MKDIPVRKISRICNEPNSLEHFIIRDVTAMMAGQDMVQDLHRHDFFYILILVKGKGEHEIDFIPYTFSDNTVFFMQPGQVHKLILKAGSTGFLIEFKNDFYPSFTKVGTLKSTAIKNYSRPDTKSFKKLFSLCDYIFQEYTDRQEGYHQVIIANLDIFFIELLRQSKESEPFHNSTNSYIQEKLAEFIQLIEVHIPEYKQASGYSRMMHLSVHQLNAITRATLDKSSSQLINDHIILEAKRYLLATTSQVNQIADHLGYEDVSYFIRFFKKHTGLSPAAFRENFR